MPKTAPFDAADYLKTRTARAEYITAALETNDPAFIRDAVGVVARSIGMSKVARQAGITREVLYKALGPSRRARCGQNLLQNVCISVPAVAADDGREVHPALRAQSVARIERSEIRDRATSAICPDFRFAQPGLRAQSSLASRDLPPVVLRKRLRRRRSPRRAPEHQGRLPLQAYRQ